MPDSVQPITGFELERYLGKWYEVARLHETRRHLRDYRPHLLKPHLVLLDEPSLGLAPMVVDMIFKEITTIAARGASVLLVEQNARKALSISHRGYVLELGKNRLTGTGRNLLASDEVQRLYLG